jgi:spermidine synthase
MIKNYSLEVAVFFCGASLMILELVGSRVLAPYVGTSTIVWTSLIGIILGALSLGYYVGGKIADIEVQARKLAVVILSAAFFVLIIILINQAVLSRLMSAMPNIYFGAVAAALVLFAVPSFILGIVSPYAVKIKIKDLQNTGRVVGDLYAISTIGSIAGTFAAGFFLIPFLGTINILYFITALLVLASILVFPKKFFGARLIFIFILLALIVFFLAKNAQADTLKPLDIDSQYNRIFISRGIDAQTKRPILRLTTDPFGTQSAMFLDKDDELVHQYTKYYRLVDVANPAINSALMIGGAAYSYPKDFLQNHPSAKIDVIEIDPKMTELAKKYFNLKNNPRLQTYNEDARVFLNQNKKKYDAIYVDAFNSHLSIPYQLTTSEAVQEISNSLSDNGVAVVNIISAFQGDKSKFLRAELATYKSIFPQVYLFQVDNSDAYNSQNIIMLALKNPATPPLKSYNAQFYTFLQRVYQTPIGNDLPVLTDNFAPVDYYTMNLVK